MAPIITPAYKPHEQEECIKLLAKLKWPTRNFECRNCGHTKYYKGETTLSRRCMSCKYDESVIANTAFEGIESKYWDRTLDLVWNLCSQILFDQWPWYIDTNNLSSYLNEINWTRTEGSLKKIKLQNIEPRVIEISKTKTRLRQKFQQWFGKQQLLLEDWVFVTVVLMPSIHPLYKEDHYLIIAEEFHYYDEGGIPSGCICADIIPTNGAENINSFIQKYIDPESEIVLRGTDLKNINKLQKKYRDIEVHNSIEPNMPLMHTISMIEKWMRHINFSISRNNAQLLLNEFCFLRNIFLEEILPDSEDGINWYFKDRVFEVTLLQLIHGENSALYRKSG